MRALFVIVTALAALYAGYWFVGSRQIEARAAAAIGDARAAGWTVDYDGLDTTGFPSRFDTTLTGLVVEPPSGAWRWAAPFVQVLALSYRPNHLIAAFPPEQVVTLGGQPVTVTAEGLRASALAGLSTRLPLRDARVESGPLSLAGQGWSVQLDRLVGGMREAPGAGPGGYDLFLDAFGIGSPRLAARLDEVRLDAGVTLDAALDRTLRGAPRLLALQVRDARLAQGDLALTAQGELAPDAAGFLAGTVTLRAENWRGMLAALTQAGVLDEGRARLFERALVALAQGREAIEVPVTFANGRVSALGLPLLDAPRLTAGG